MGSSGAFGQKFNSVTGKLGEEHGYEAGSEDHMEKVTSEEGCSLLTDAVLQ